MIKIEVCAASIESMLAAVEGGASRVELCDNLLEGGTTPPLSWIEKSIKHSDIQTFVLIRPRGSDFLYTESEFLSMKRDIMLCGEAGCHGVVLGILTPDGKIDIKRSKKLIQLAKSYAMEVTYHRAIDRTDNILEAMETIINLGCDKILTSGGRATALEGMETLKSMIKQANNRIIIIPASGINEDNIVEIAQNLDTKEFHGSFRHKVNSKMNYVKDNIDAYNNEYTIMVTSADKVRKIVSLVNNE